jgi:hypothetical protein
MLERAGYDRNTGMHCKPGLSEGITNSESIPISYGWQGHDAMYW